MKLDLRSTHTNNVLKSEPSTGIRDSRWLLSLADLVTLLLAVTAVSLSSGRLESFAANRGGAIQGQSGVGIVIAHSEEEALSKTVFLFEEQFTEGGKELSAQAAKHLEFPKNCRGSCLVNIEVMSCSPEKEGLPKQFWHESLLRLLTLHRHLFDGKGVRAEQVLMTSLGNHCDLLGFAEESSGRQPVMAVRFKENTEVQNG